MINSEKMYLHSLLADAAYAKFDNVGETYGEQLMGRFGSSNLSDYVSAHWRIPSQGAHLANTSQGFSATLFESIDVPGRKVLAFRGTEPSDPHDLSTDLMDVGADGMALHQIVDLYNFVQRLKAGAGALYTTAKLVEVSVPATISVKDFAERNGYIYNRPGQALRIELQTSSSADGLGLIHVGSDLSVTGHSLGGHLAMAFNLLFPEFGATVYTVNGAGIRIDDSNVARFFNQLKGGSTGLSYGSVVNMFNEVGWNGTTADTAILTQIGQRTPIYAETNNASVLGHGADLMTNALAVYDLFIRLDRNLADMSPLSAVSVLTPILKAGGNDNLIDLEGAVAALGRTLVDANFATPAKDDRDGLFSAIKQIDQCIARIAPGVASVSSLVDKGASSVADVARGNSSKATAYRVALLTLSPFAIVGAPTYATGLDCSLFDPATGQGSLSDAFLTDRAAMLSFKLAYDSADKAYDQFYTSSGRGGPNNPTYRQLFVDGTTGLSIDTSGTGNEELDRRFYFGSSGDDTYSGGIQSDRLYGMAGADALNGDAGSDYLEGGAGNDQLRGGAGADDLVGGADNDAAYGEDGNDSLYGGIGNDSLFGGANDDLLQGWDGSDNLSGEDGNDQIKGGAGIDILDGGKHNDALFGGDDADSLTGGTGNDWLEGGAGADVYYFKPGDGHDVIVDADGAGRIEVDDGVNVAVLTGGKGKPVSGQWSEVVHGQKYTYALAPDASGSGNLVIRRDDGSLSITVRGFQNGRLGITLSDLPVPAVTPPANAGQTSSEYTYQQPSFDAKAGNDVVVTQAGADTIDGGDGNDYLVSTPGNKLIVGGAGDDMIETGAYYVPNASLSEVTQPQNWQQGWADWHIVTLGEDTHQWSRTLKDAQTGQALGSYQQTWRGAYYYEIRSSDARGWRPEWKSAFTDPQTLNGGLGNDTVDASNGDDVISGEDGDDLLMGGEQGNDTFYGGVGADRIMANAGDDLVLAGDDNDFMDGSDGNDTLFGGLGADTLLGDGVESGLASRDDMLDGGDGDDLIDAGGGNDKVFGGDGNDVLFAASIYDPDALEANLVDGGNGADKIVGSAGGDTLMGGSGNDVISGSGGAQATGGDHDVIYGDDGDDLVVADGGNDQVDGGNGNDSLHGDNGLYVETLHGDDVMHGQAGNDSLLGYGGDDSLYGEADNDTLQGANGKDYLDGGAGIDLLEGGDGDDQIYGGEGNDGLDGTGAQRVANGGALRGGKGNDKLYGGAGQDGLAGDEGNDALSGDDGDDQLDGGLGDDALDGGSDNDVLLGGDGSDTLAGGAGSDVLQGGSGNDTYIYTEGVDLIEDTGGVDTLQMGSMSRDSVSLKQVGSQLQIINADGTGIVIEGGFTGTIDRFKFGGGVILSADELIDGLAADPLLTPQTARTGLYQPLAVTESEVSTTQSTTETDPDDLDLRQFLRLGKESFYLRASPSGGTLYGGGAGDTLYGQSGDDLLYGAAGNDTIDGWYGADYLEGEDGDDEVNGADGNDTLVGGAGNDLLRGGDGADVYVFASGFGQDTIKESDGWSYPVNAIRFSDPVDLNALTLSRSRLNVTFAFANGDRLTVENFFATPTYSNFNVEFADGTIWKTDDIKQRVLVLATEGNDDLSGWDSDNYIDGKGGNDTLSGDSGQDTLIGGAGDDYLTGFDGNDVFIGGDGSDTVDGGVGDDTYVYQAGTVAETILAWTDKGNNVIQIDGAVGGLMYVRPVWDRKDLLIGVYQDNPNNKKYLVLEDVFSDSSQAGSYSIYLSSTGQGISWAEIQQLMLLPTPENNTLWGTKAAESIHGAGGNDDLHGWAGDDTLSGDQGLDTLEGGQGNDLYLMERGQGRDAIFDEAGTDTLRIGAGIAPTQLVLQRVGDALYVASQDGALQARITSHFKLTNSLRANAIEKIEFADGTSWTLELIDAKANVTTADTMAGTSGNDTFIYDNNADVITEQANAGDDTVRAALDYWLGSYGANIENAQATGYFDVSLTGNGLNNRLTGNVAANILDGGAGIDTLVGGNGDDTYYALDQGDVVSENENEGHDVIYVTYDYVLPESIEDVTLYNGHGKSLIGNAQDNVLDATAASGWTAYLDGGAGNDTMYGSISSTTKNVFVVDSVGDNIAFRGGIYAKQNTVRTSLDYVLPNEIDNIQLTGVANISATGNAADNVMDGTTSDGSNTLRGGAGNDTYQIDLRDVVVEKESEGRDAIILTDSIHQSGMTIRLSDYSNIEHFTWNGAIDGVLHGSAVDNRLVVSGGTIYAGDGNDWATGVNVYGGAGNDTLEAYAADSGPGNDLIYLTGRWDTNVVSFDAGYGEDTVFAAGGELLLGPSIKMGDLLFEKDGLDLVIKTAGSGDSIRLSAQYTSNGFGAGLRHIHFQVGNEVYLSLEFASGQSSIIPTNSATDSDDLVSRSTNPDNPVLNALNGNDYLIGGEQSDVLIGGGGSDVLYGSYGEDTYKFNPGDGLDQIRDAGFNPHSGVTEINWIEFGEGISAASLETSADYENAIIKIGESDQITVYGLMQENGPAFMGIRFSDGSTITPSQLLELCRKIVGTTGADSLVGGDTAEQMSGLAGNDTVQGGGGNDTLDGGADVDRLEGGSGNDRYLITSGDTVYELADEETDTVVADFGYTLPTNVENLVLSGSAAINATGNALGNYLLGNSAANVLDGKAGVDTLEGGAGNDTYVVDNVGDVVTENANEGTDLISANVTYSIAMLSNVENLTLTGTSAINATGNEANNALTGNSGNNVLDGGLGNDTLVGGTGNDTYIVDSLSDVVTEASSAGTDTIQASLSYSIASLGNIERLTLTGSAAINATGNGLANLLTGNSGNNRLDGGTGNDTMLGGTGDDTYVFNVATDVATENANEGIDTIETGITLSLAAINNVENLTLTGTSAVNATGNALDNVLKGNSANNRLTGGAGNDRLDGGTGNDTMLGGTGNDTYVVNVSTDVVTENANEGSDTVESSITYTIASLANLEHITLTGTGAINATGNAVANRLTGNSGVNTLTGGAGNDTLDGAAGNDSLVGGTGNDTYVLGRGYGADTVTENDSTAGNTDVASFMSGISTDQIWFRKVNTNDLEVSVIGTSDKLTLKSWYLGNAYHVEQFKTADGKLLVDADVQKLVDAMAAFAPPSAGQTTLPGSYQDALNPVLAANWH